MMKNTNTHAAALHPRRTAEYPVLLSLAALEEIFSSCAEFQAPAPRSGIAATGHGLLAGRFGLRPHADRGCDPPAHDDLAPARG